MSIFDPKWMSDNPFYPTWMGGVEVQVEIEVPSTITSGGSGYEFFEYNSSDIFNLYINSIKIKQKDPDINVQSATNFISNISVPKLKNIPTINTVKINFKENV